MPLLGEIVVTFGWYVRLWLIGGLLFLPYPIGVVSFVDLAVKLFYLLNVPYVLRVNVLALFLALLPALYLTRLIQLLQDFPYILEADRIAKIDESEHVYSDAIDVLDYFLPVLLLIQGPGLHFFTRYCLIFLLKIICLI